MDALSDKKTQGVISFFRDYMVSDIIATLINIREDKIDRAIEIQEFILDEIVFEMSPIPNRYSISELEALRATFAKIADYYSLYPRNNRKWYQELSPEKKQNYAKIDEQLAAVVAWSDFETNKEDSVKTTMPLLIFRDYMASIAVQTLVNLAEGQKESILWDLEEVLDMTIRENRALLSDDHANENYELSQLYKIKKYRTKYPRAGNSWYPWLSESQKEELNKLDDKLAHAVSSNRLTAWPVFFGVEPR